MRPGRQRRHCQRPRAVWRNDGLGNHLVTIVQRDRGSRFARAFKRDRLTRLQSGGYRPLDLRCLACGRCGRNSSRHDDLAVDYRELDGCGGRLLLAIRAEQLGHQVVRAEGQRRQRDLPCAIRRDDGFAHHLVAVINLNRRSRCAGPFQRQRRIRLQTRRRKLDFRRLAGDRRRLTDGHSQGFRRRDHIAVGVQFLRDQRVRAGRECGHSNAPFATGIGRGFTERHIAIEDAHLRIWSCRTGDETWLPSQQRCSCHRRRQSRRCHLRGAAKPFRVQHDQQNHQDPDDQYIPAIQRTEPVRAFCSVHSLTLPKRSVAQPVQSMTRSPDAANRAPDRFLAAVLR